MAFKTGIFSLALGTLLLGSTSQAQEPQAAEADLQFQAEINFNGSAEDRGHGFHGDDAPAYAWNDRDHRRGHRRGHGKAHVHSRYCTHGPRPAPPIRQQGRYELKLVQKWIPGRYEQVWVPEVCQHRPRRHVVKCRGGYYDQQWVPGRYETVEEWVWVPASRHRHWGRG